jgi:hypothetical protein
VAPPKWFWLLFFKKRLTRLKQLWLLYFSLKSGSSEETFSRALPKELEPKL